MNPVLEALRAVDLSRVPVMSTDRCIPRKEQARLARELFKRLGVKGISVTTPNYSMAQSVDVRIPSEPHEPGDYLLGDANYEHRCYSDMPDAVPCKQKMLRQSEARELAEAILARAFPKHDDRSEMQSDYFDYCWSFN